MVDSSLRLLRTAGPLRSRILRVYAFLFAFNIAPGPRARGLDRVPDPPAHGPPRLHVRPAPCGRRRPHRGHRQHDPQADAGRPAPVGVGLFFSLGHSTIVVALSVLIAISAGIVSDIPALQEIGGLIGTSVSAVFLLLIGFINLVVLDRHLPDVPARLARAARTTSRPSRTSSTTAACSPGSSGRCCELIRKSWHMYPLGRAVRPRVRHRQRGRAARPGGDVRRQPRADRASS